MPERHPYAALGDALRAARERAGLSQAALARLAGAHPSQYGEVERGEQRFGRERLRRVAVVLGLDAEETLRLAGYRERGGVMSTLRPSRPYAALGETLRAARTQAGLSQRAAGRAAGVGTTQYSLAERGYERLGRERLRRVAAVLGLDAEELVRLADYRPGSGAMGTGHPYAALGEALRGARERAGLAQAEAARRVGVRRQYYWSVEHGRERASRERLARVAEVLGLDPAALERLAGYPPEAS